MYEEKETKLAFSSRSLVKRIESQEKLMYQQAKPDVM